mgnify:CR=1 FL=1
MIHIRPERFADIEAVRAVNTAAFGRRTEASLVDRLRDEARPIVSLVAVEGDEIVGHILFTPVMLEGHDDLMLMALGPMAVRPERQRRGTGSELVLWGLDACERLGCQAAFVLGEPRYYRRFRFEPASRFGIVSEYENAGDAFMAQELAEGALEGRSGTVRYHRAFSEQSPD